MLDGAEAILKEEGYGALTSRRVAEQIGVKQRLIYYYFHTMDELIIETFRRSSARDLERMRNMLATERPLSELWDVCIHTHDVRLISEFMALANRSAGLREEVVAFIEKSREIQIEALVSTLARTKAASSIPPEGLALLATSAALAMTREAALGITTGHKAIQAVIETYIAALEK
jgi:AcrR family transcriptional regulator